MDQIPKTEEEWKEKLSREAYQLLREKATEPPFSGKYNNFYEKGTYHCAACGNPLFSSDAKYHSGSGWPSFFEPIDSSHIKTYPDNSLSQPRIEVVCAACESHLGHVFDDGPVPTGLRYCMNSGSLDFKSKDR